MFCNIFQTNETVGNVERENESIHLLNSNGNEEFVDTESSLSCVFGRIDHFEVIPNLNAVRICNYKLINDLKLSLADLVEFIWTVPEVLLYEKFNFIYEFLVKLGVSPDTITSEVYQTQCRRAQNKFPASTLLLKLGIPESTLVKSYDVNQYNHHHDDPGSETSNNLSRRTSFSSQSEADSGIESWDNFESSTSVSPSPDFDTPSMKFKSPDQLVFAKKSKVVEVIEEGPQKLNPTEFSHAAGKQFKCTVCPKRYITKGNCNWHIRKRHPGACLLPGSKLFRQPKSYYCPFCGKAFTYPQYVKNHIERLHPESSSSNLQQKFTLHSSFKSKKMKNLGNLKLRHQQRNKIASIVISTNSRRGHHHHSKKSLRKLVTSSKLNGL